VSGKGPLRVKGMPMSGEGGTFMKRREQFRDRWSSQEKSSGILELSELLSPEELRKIEILRDLDDTLLTKLSPDISVARWKEGAVLFEEGSYIDLAFYVLEGEVEMFFRKDAPPLDADAPVFDENRTIGGGTLVRGGGELSVFRSQVNKQPERAADITFLSVMDFDLPAGSRAMLGRGELFGEIGALSGWPQAVTARVVSPCRLLQIRVPALRTLRRRSKPLRERLDTLYRERSLGVQIKATPLFRGLDERTIRGLVDSAELVSCEPDEVVAAEGEAAGFVYLVRSGFVKLTQKVASGPLAVTYLSKGMTFGETECLAPDLEAWTATASSVKYSELVRFDRASVRELAERNRGFGDLLWTTALSRLEEIGRVRRDLGQSEFLNTALETGLVQGNSVLVIDLERCTRCDDCVNGCKETHGGLPRFVREGDKVENLLIAKSCYHCRDPVCLVGCPTGAIRRANVGAVVEISEPLCIGCSACAGNCPYDAIVMQETGDAWPADAVPEGLRGKPRKFASKCDLCHTSPQGPACVRNCPNECAYRVGSLEEFRALLSKE
jgi:Fe-S-cluster-containing dehydrogenase component